MTWFYVRSGIEYTKVEFCDEKEDLCFDMRMIIILFYLTRNETLLYTWLSTSLFALLDTWIPASLLINSHVWSTRQRWGNMIKSKYWNYRSSMLDHSYQFYIWIYDIPRIYENSLMTENIAYSLSKRWWQRRGARNIRGWNWRLMRPSNRDIWGIKINQ